MNRRIAALTAGVLVTVSALAGCSLAYGENSTVEPLVTQDVADSEALLETLRWAETIELEKAILSLNDVYTVKADGVEVGEIRGQFIYALGDTHSLFTLNGNLVASEGEQLRFVTAGASMFDYNNQPVGELSQNFTPFLKNWSILDNEGQKIGQAKGEFSLTIKFDVLNAADEVEYEIEKALFSIGSKLTITRISNEPNISAVTAIWLATVNNEIHEAEQENNQ